MSRHNEDLCTLLELCFPQLKKYILALVRSKTLLSEQDQRDIVQQVFVKMLEGVEGTGLAVVDKHHLFAVAGKATSWVLATFFRARGAKKRGGGQSRVEVMASDLEAAPSNQHNDEGELARKLTQLTDTQTKVVRMRYADGRSCDQIAISLDLSVQEVYLICARSIACLRAEPDAGVVKVTPRGQSHLSDTRSRGKPSVSPKIDV